MLPPFHYLKIAQEMLNKFSLQSPEQVWLSNFDRDWTSYLAFPFIIICTLRYTLTNRNIKYHFPDVSQNVLHRPVQIKDSKPCLVFQGILSSSLISFYYLTCSLNGVCPGLQKRICLFPRKKKQCNSFNGMCLVLQISHIH